MAVDSWRPFTHTVERWDPFRDLTEIQIDVM